MNESNVDKGIITYIYLENFVTYDRVAVKPGRNLNVIIGPNGTGKSTIVCAIVLGLGGKPSTIGRAVHVTEYIKAGCEEATIEIHLSSGKPRDVVIKRMFNRKGNTQWFIDDRYSNIKAVQDLTRSFNIQIDNLCQFLPQDKVQDFSKMNAQELLQNTERSVGDPKIFENHQKLINHKTVYKDLGTQIANKTKILQAKIQIYEGLKESVSSIKERKLIKKKIIALKQKKAWMLYEQMRRELLRLKKKKEDAAKNMATLESELRPINTTIEKIKSDIKMLQNSVINHDNKVNIKTAKLKTLMDEIQESGNKIKECENVCKHRIQAEQARDNDIEFAQQQKSKLDADLFRMINDVGSEETLIKQQSEIISHINKHRNVISSLTNRNSALKEEEERVNRDIRSQETEIQVLDIEAKRLQLLREKNVDAYKAVHWLRENRSKFSGTIHEPMLLSINVKDASYAKYLEKIIPYRDLIAFVCENKQDMNLLLRCLRDEQHLQVNAVHSDPMKNVSMQPSIALENIKRFGFTNYLVSLIEAPSTIMKYLVTMYNLNNIPVGTNFVEDNVDNIPHALNCYFSKNNLYAVSMSKYTGEKSTRMQPVSSTGMLGIVLDKSKILRIQEKLRVLRENKNSINNQIKEIEEQIGEKYKDVDQYRIQRNKCQQDIQHIQALKSRISMFEKKIQDLENERTTIEQINESSTAEIKVILNKQLKIFKTYNSELEECFKCVTANEEIKLAMRLQNRSLRSKTNESQDLREKLRAAEQTLKQMSAELQPLKNEVQKLYQEALDSTNGINPSEEAFAPINKAFNKLPPTIEEINTELNIAQAKVFCMGNNIDGENVLREYEDVGREISHLKEFIQTKTQEMETSAAEIEVLRNEWLVPLAAIIERINANFSSYFSAMDCAGEVTLCHGEDIMDFDQYGLKIKVKFRDTDQLQELTRHHQSGGERAVTTAIYMISLQELSRVPFRCVDEINQGMDAVNERRVFNLLVKMTGRPNSSQYFLLTPKLLPDLQYSDTVTVHCVFNGPFMTSHTEFDTAEYCKHVMNTLEKENLGED